VVAAVLLEGVRAVLAESAMVAGRLAPAARPIRPALPAAKVSAAAAVVVAAAELTATAPERSRFQARI
jgi:hypothetical protein